MDLPKVIDVLTPPIADALFGRISSLILAPQPSQNFALSEFSLPQLGQNIKPSFFNNNIKV